MSDELTPEERELLKSLSRERIPSAGLEDRVVGAMRDRGFIAKRPGRAVRITNSRVAGLLAACIVLVIGAYSIGLHRGNRIEVIERITPAQDRRLVAQSSESGTLEVPPATDMKPSVPASEMLPEKDAGTANLDEVVPGHEKSRPKLKWDLNKKESPLPGLVYQEGSAPASKPEARPAQRSNAPAAGAPEGRSDVTEQPASERVQSLADREAVAPAPMKNLAARDEARVAFSPKAATQERSSQTFMLGGTPFTVEAPDSVRIVREEHGRTLLIYTSDGLIRIHVAN